MEQQFNFYQKLYEIDNMTDSNIKNYLDEINNLSRLNEQEKML